MGQQRLPPFTEELIDDNDEDALYTDVAADDYLRRELHTAVLDELADNLSLAAKKVPSNIDALHIQAIKKRDVILTEDPALHLVWYYDNIWIKPIPPVLLNSNFWLQSLLHSATRSRSEADHYDVDSLSASCRDALGFLRTYSYLIVHRSDFHRAQELHLIPQGITYAKLHVFLRCFRHLPDEIVSRRYHYGQFRLTRLNMAVRLYGPASSKSRWYYRRRYWQTGQYMQALVGPALFVFAAVSLILSSMSVVLQTRPDRSDGSWPAFRDASSGFALAVITGIPFFSVCVAVVLCATVIHHSIQGSVHGGPAKRSAASKEAC